MRANSGELTQELTTVRRSLSAIGGVAKAAAATVAGLGAAFAALAVEQVNSVTETKRWADQLGISTQRLMELSSVFSTNANVNAEQFRDTMQELNVRLGEAAITGGGALAEAFEAIGLKVEDVRAMKTDEMVLAIADAFKDLDDQQALAFVSGELFAGEAEKMVEVLKLGGREINSMTEEYRAMNGVLTDIEAIEMEEASKSLKSLATATDALGREMVLLMVGPAKDFVDWLGGAVRGIREFSNDIERSNVDTRISEINASIAAANRTIDQYDGRAPDDHWWSKMAENAKVRVQELNAELEGLEERKRELDLSFDAWSDDGMDSHVQYSAAAEAAKAAEDAGKTKLKIQGEKDDPAKRLREIFGGDPEDVRQRLEDEYKKEFELIRENAMKKMTLANNLRNEGIISEQKHNELKLKISKKAAADEAKLTEATEAAKEAAIKRGQRATLQATASFLGMLGEKNKNFAIAEAIINTYLGVSKTLATYPYPYNLVPAALHLAQGIAQVSAIRSGGGGGSVTGGGSVPSIPTAEGVEELGAANEDPVQNKTITIAIDGDSELLPRSVLRELADELNSLEESNVRISV